MRRTAFTIALVLTALGCTGGVDLESKVPTSTRSREELNAAFVDVYSLLDGELSPSWIELRDKQVDMCLHGPPEAVSDLVRRYYKVRNDEPNLDFSRFFRACSEWRPYICGVIENNSLDDLRGWCTNK